ncbi:hypothetical protein BDN72DRAFT_965924 [Pluteus cervinus]|uniref:Uncharacterized protein n=1 Tax=Pluteus cervinus TaxID=181527 RepID=A0ACD3A2N1_9AGAR|nr:hypothetical protein BDN72DRAFT_965924 [Pluteus cervinus]
MLLSGYEHDQQPRLPPELEQVIFEYAFFYDREHPLNLLLISKRVHDWYNTITSVSEIIPLVYDVLLIGSIPLQSLSRHGHHVRHLLLIHDDISIVQILQCCKNVINLGMWTVPYASEWVFEALTLSLTRMAGYMTLPLGNGRTPLQLCTTTTTSQSELSPGYQPLRTPYCNWTSTITHLEIPVTSNYWPNYEPLSQFTVLTHLSLSYTTEIRLLEQIFNICPQLEVVIWEHPKRLTGMEIMCVPTPSVRLHEDDGLVEGVDDLRVVAVDRSAMVDWMVGARGGMDVWKLAEEEVKRRMVQKLQS